MADILTKEQRHKNMQNIRSQDTKPELVLRKALWRKGYRYRKNYKFLPGKPDIVLIKQKICRMKPASENAAGSKKVFELHGSVHRNYCESCGKFYPPEYIRDRKHLLRDGVNYFKTFIRNNANQMLELQVGDDSYTGIITGYHTIGKYLLHHPGKRKSRVQESAGYYTDEQRRIDLLGDECQTDSYYRRHK